jgi:hypothetical protein
MQLTAILSPSYTSNASNASSTSPSSQPSPRNIGARIIAGTVVAAVVVLSTAGALVYFLLRRRNRSTSTTPTDIALTLLDGTQDDKKSVLHSPRSLFLLDMKPDPVPSIHSQYQPKSELSTQGEIFQLPSNDNREGGYFTAASQIEWQRRAANTPDIAGAGAVYELQGSEPASVNSVKFDDARSWEGLSPLLAAARGPSSRVSSRTNSPLAVYRTI